MDLTFYFTTIYSVDYIYNHISMIGDWQREQLLFFITFMLAIDNLHMGILSESFWMLSHHIKSGDLDYILLKPTNTVFNIFFRYFRPSSLFYAPVSWGYLIYYAYINNISTLSWILLPILIVLSFTLLAIMEFIISSLMFYMIEGIGINFIRMQFQNISRWPDFIFSRYPRKIFTIIIPALVIGSFPLKFLLNNNQWIYIFYLFIANIIALLILKIIWPLALKKYESASS